MQPLRGQAGQGQLEVAAHLARHRGGTHRVHATGVGEHKEERRVIQQRGTQRVLIPTGQQQAGMHRLRTGRAIVEHDNFGISHSSSAFS